MSTISRIRGLSWVVPFLWGLSGVEGQEGFWGEERRLGGEINNGQSALTPAVSADGLTLIFQAGWNSRPGGDGRRDLWIATRNSEVDEFGDVKNLIHVNSPERDQQPSLSMDGTRLYFKSEGHGARGTGARDPSAAEQAGGSASGGGRGKGASGEPLLGQPLLGRESEAFPTTVAA